MHLFVKNVHFTFVLLRTHSFKAVILSLTEREVFTEKYRNEIFFVQTKAKFVHKTKVRYLSVKTKLARLIKSLLYGIYT